MNMERKRDRLGMVSRVAGWRPSAGGAWGGEVLALVLLACVVACPVGSAYAEEVACPNGQLRAEQPYGLGLPDCRAYEMVSPLEKGGAAVGSTDSRAAISGEALTYISPGSFRGSGPEPVGAALVSRYLSRRGPDGWSTTNITPPYDTLSPQTTTSFQELLFTPELSVGLLESRFTPLVKGDPPGYVNLYRADTEDGSYQRVSDVTPPAAEIPPYTIGVVTSSERPQAAGASTDLNHVVFQQKASLVGGASPYHEHVYEWAGGPLSQVDVPPAGIKFEGEDNVGAPGEGEEVATFGNSWRAVSADGSRVFFTAGEKQQTGEKEFLSGQLYVRENPEEPQSPYVGGSCSVPGDACTVEVSASQRTNAGGEPDPDPDGPRPAFYRGASLDGSRVFFTSRAELTNDANTGEEDNAANLYAYDVETGALSDLTPEADIGPEDPQGAAVLGLVTASEDGSYVYFVANGVLSQAANSEGVKATPGDCKVEEEENLVGERTCSLYVEHYDGSGWEPPVFIASLVGGDKAEAGVSEAHDETDWLGYEYSSQHGLILLHDWGPGLHTARVSGGGVSLAFESQRSLTGYENEQAEAGECGESESGRCREVYVYDVGSGSHPPTLVCASCDPNSGVRPVGPAVLGAQEKSLEAHAGNEISSFYVQRNLSEGGGRLFFQSPDPLVPRDSNGRTDVYEWERPATASEVVKGENSCTSSSPEYHAGEEGCVFAISDVAGDYESEFMDASSSGGDVFIATTDQLLASDTDSRADVYDVRVGGGFPVSVASAVCTNADSCKLPVSPQPGVFGVPASATFSGPVSLVPPLPSGVVKPMVLTRAQELTRALKACRRERGRKRAGCVRAARRRYGARVASRRRSAGGGGR